MKNGFELLFVEVVRVQVMLFQVRPRVRVGMQKPKIWTRSISNNPVYSTGDGIKLITLSRDSLKGNGGRFSAQTVIG